MPISIDTYKAAVAERAIDLGAAIVNDISALTFDPALADVVARDGARRRSSCTRAGARATCTRWRSTRDVGARSRRRAARHALDVAEAAGIPRDAIIVDPGLGFAKQAEHSHGRARRLPRSRHSGCPILSGPSRKSFLTAALGDVPPRERVWGTAAAVTAAVLLGAHIVRVHDVAEMVAGRARTARSRSWRLGRALITLDTLFAAHEPAGRLAAAPAAVSWWDVLDILIVSILIYEALKLIRGTRAMQMAIGSRVRAAAVLRLAPVPAADRQLAHPQPARVHRHRGDRAVSADIRRALSHLGRAPFFRYFARAEQSAESIEEVITAAGLLAKAHVGAIIVFEREIGLRNYVESGIPHRRGASATTC